MTPVLFISVDVNSDIEFEAMKLKRGGFNSGLMEEFCKADEDLYTIFVSTIKNIVTLDELQRKTIADMNSILRQAAARNPSLSTSFSRYVIIHDSIDTEIESSYSFVRTSKDAKSVSANT